MDKKGKNPSWTTLQRSVCIIHSLVNFRPPLKMCRSRRKFNFQLQLLIFGCIFGTTVVSGEGEEISAVTVPTPSSTQRSILVLKISPNFGGGSGSADGDEFIRNLNKRLEGYKKRISEYDTTNVRKSNEVPARNPHFPYEYPFKPPKEDLEYHTNAILYFIAISIVIVAIGIVSCLCINKSMCHKAVGEMTARANRAAGGNSRRATGVSNRGSRVNSNLSIISGTTTATTFSTSPSVTNVNFSATGANSPATHYVNANFDDGIHIKVMHDLPPSYESLFPVPTPTSTTDAAAESPSVNVNTISTTIVSAAATAIENTNVETAKT